jgi:hypothetical protein
MITPSKPLTSTTDTISSARIDPREIAEFKMAAYFDILGGDASDTVYKRNGVFVHKLRIGGDSKKAEAQGSLRHRRRR